MCVCVCLSAFIILSNPSGSLEVQSVPRGGARATRTQEGHTQSSAAKSTRSKTASAKNWQFGNWKLAPSSWLIKLD